jgi:ATP-dependent DNA helicase RecG
VGDGRIRARIADAPFALTGSQRRALKEIAEDNWRPRTLRLPGDVGSGKTVVALMAMAIAVEAGAQAALMAPTEVLPACRHHAPLADAAGLRVALLTGARRPHPPTCWSG